MKLEQKSGFRGGYMPLTASIPDVVTPQGVAKAFQWLAEKMIVSELFPFT